MTSHILFPTKEKVSSIRNNIWNVLNCTQNTIIFMNIDVIQYTNDINFIIE